MKIQHIKTWGKQKNTRNKFHRFREEQQAQVNTSAGFPLSSVQSLSRADSL